MDEFTELDKQNAETVEPADYTAVAPEQPQDGRMHPDVHPDVEKRRRDLRDVLGWSDGRLNELAATMAPDDYLGIAGAEAIEIIDPRGVSKAWFPRFEPTPAPPAVEAPPERHTCYEWKRCADCGRLFKAVLGEPLP